MYRPTPIEMYNYDEYKEYIHHIIQEIENDNEKDKEEIKKNLKLYKEDPSIINRTVDGDIEINLDYLVNTDYLINVVGLCYIVFLRKKQYKELLDELDFLNTEDGKEAYINKKDRYSNIELL